MKTWLFISPVVLLFILSSCSTKRETQYSYSTQLDYYPVQKEDVSDGEYQKGTSILQEMYASIKEDSFKFSHSHHLNIARAFKFLGEPKKKILSEIRLAQEKDISKSAKLFTVFYKTPDKFNLTQAEFDSLMRIYKPIYERDKINEKGTDPADARNKILKTSLYKLIDWIEKSDQKYRGEGREYYMKHVRLQDQIDSINMVKIDSLYAKYGRYIGKSMVTESREYVMWAVIQHASLEKQEYYLPIVQQAVETDELKKTPLKMLIDRIYTKKYGYQIFGSQMAVDLASEEEIQRVRMKYKIL